ncbi:MAG TPA: SDR family oxidoreductase, partial [Woeseiaceae bacterium]|nr:SDR family oxidoreductase [Woeseiaceae bacterium]
MNANNNHSAAGRVKGRNVIVTGAAGNIGTYITRLLLKQGANVVLTGRTQEKLEGLIDELVREGHGRERLAAAAGDCADPEACRSIVATAVERFGEIDVLVNNAGAAGPKRTLRRIPFTNAEKRALGEDQTMFESAMNLLGGPWHMVRASVPHMAVGASIVNVSTIFSRTRYFGRIAYSVPKSGLNALSHGLARELGGSEKGIRVNTVFPGPIESERIDKAFAAMDALQGQPEGTTSGEFRDLMIVKRPDAGGGMDFRYPTPDDVASTVLFLSSDDSRAFSGHGFEVTNGMQVPARSRSKLVSWPDDRLVDLGGRVVLILCGSDTDEAMVFAERNLHRGAQVVMCSRTLDAVGYLRARVQEVDPAIQVQHMDPLRPESMERVFQFIADHYGRLDGVIVLPATPNGQHGYSLSTADDDDVAAFVENEVVAPVAFASALTRRLASWKPRRPAPQVTFVTNPDDGHGNLLNDIKRAAVEELIRVWRFEERHED